MGDVNQALSFFFTWNSILFCLGVVAVSFMVRRIVENVWPVYIGNRIWRDAILPTVPVVFGAVTAALVSSYPYPEGITTWSGRFFFGAVSGFLSSWVFRLIRATWKTASGSDPGEPGAPV